MRNITNVTSHFTYYKLVIKTAFDKIEFIDYITKKMKFNFTNYTYIGNAYLDIIKQLYIIVNYTVKKEFR